jgi:hypothetical protein
MVVSFTEEVLKIVVVTKLVVDVNVKVGVLGSISVVEGVFEEELGVDVSGWVSGLYVTD